MRALLVAVAALVLLPGAASAATVQRDLAYDLDGSVPTPRSQGRLDLHRPDGVRRGDRRPIVVYVHGGGWAVGDKARVGAKARLFTGQGYLFASVNHRLSARPPRFDDPRRVRFPDHPRDVGEAIAWLHRNARRLGGDGRRIMLVGHSAGAHLAALVATDPRYLRRFRVPPGVVRGFVPLDTAAFDVRADIGTAQARRRVLLENAFGTPAEEAASPRWDAASLVRHADRGDPPAIVVKRSGPGAAEARRYARALGARLLLVDRTHAQINADLGSPADPTPLTRTVRAFARRVLGR